MGYYTRYSLSIIEGDEYKHKTEFATTVDGKQVEIIVASNSDILKDVKDTLGVEDGHACKWYYHHSNMIDVSEIYPNTVFMLEGRGEDPDDIWRKYYKNGLSQITDAVITFDKYDESKLS